MSELNDRQKLALGIINHRVVISRSDLKKQLERTFRLGEKDGIYNRIVSRLHTDGHIVRYYSASGTVMFCTKDYADMRDIKNVNGRSKRAVVKADYCDAMNSFAARAMRIMAGV
jgi:hypothetical protein